MIGRCNRFLNLFLLFLFVSTRTSVDGFVITTQRQPWHPPPTTWRLPSLSAALRPTDVTQRKALSLLLPTISKPSVNTFAVVSGCAILLAYHFRLYRKEKQGERTWRSAQADTRERWSQFVRKTEGWLYAIQTLRNAITAQTFLATTVLSLLTVITGRLWEIIRNMATTTTMANDPSLAMNRKYLVTQFVMVAACMLTSAYHFLQSARLMTHAGFMFPVQPEKTKVDRIMRKSQNAQWLGLRWLYLSAAMIAWVVGGPLVFWVASVMLSVFFFQIDKVPQEVDDDHTYEI